MKIAALQTDIAWEDPAANHEALRPLLRAAAGTGARLIVLPEMYACGFSMATERIAEPEDGPSTVFLREQARELGVWLCGSVPARAADQDRPHNTLVLAGPGDELHRYRKLHPFTYAQEDEHYAPGDALVTVNIEGVRLSLFVCYDLRFADEFWQLAGQTDCYVVVANWPEARRRHWQILLRARAIENQAYVVGLNRVGYGGAQKTLAYSGDSAIIDPWGEVLVEGSRDPTMLVGEIDPGRVADARRRFPVLRDRRTHRVEIDLDPQ